MGYREKHIPHFNQKGGIEPFQMPFEDFYKAYYYQGRYLRKKQIEHFNLLSFVSRKHTIKDFLKEVHVDEILKAIEADLDIPFEVLKEYELYKDLRIPIRKYCKSKSISLD